MNMWSHAQESVEWNYLFVYKSRNEMLPEFFANMFIHVDEVHSYNSRNSPNNHLYTSFQFCVGKNVWSKQAVKCGTLHYQK